MPSGFTVSGRGDLDSIFAPRYTSAAGNVGYSVGGVDLAQRYESRGGLTPVANVGFASAGVDLSQIFAGVVASTSTTVSMVAGSVASASTYYGLVAGTGGAVVAGSRNPTTHAGHTIVGIEQVNLNNSGTWNFIVRFYNAGGAPPYTAQLLKRVVFTDRNVVVRTYRTHFDSPPSSSLTLVRQSNMLSIQWTAPAPADQLFNPGSTYSISLEV